MADQEQSQQQDKVHIKTRDTLRKESMREWISIVLDVIAIIIAIITGFYGFLYATPLFWALLVVIVILLISLVYSVVEKVRSIPTLKSKEAILRRLAVEKSQIEGIIKEFGAEIISYRIDDYYAGLRYVCTTIHEDKEPEFSEILWQHWQLKGAPRSSTVKS